MAEQKAWKNAKYYLERASKFDDGQNRTIVAIPIVSTNMLENLIIEWDLFEAG